MVEERHGRDLIQQGQVSAKVVQDERSDQSARGLPSRSMAFGGERNPTTTRTMIIKTENNSATNTGAQKMLPSGKREYQHLLQRV
jgi:hypothetical protein